MKHMRSTEDSRVPNIVDHMYTTDAVGDVWSIPSNDAGLHNRHTLEVFPVLRIHRQERPPLPDKQPRLTGIRAQPHTTLHES